MGNLFIGFPVPRAKIATMIEEAAPPLKHKINHQPDGSDPLVLPGDISNGQAVTWNSSEGKFVGSAVGGISSIFDDPGRFYSQLFHDLTSFENNATSGGATAWSEGRRYIKTGSVADSTYRLDFYAGNFLDYPLWSKIRKFKTLVFLEDYRPTDGLTWIVSGWRNSDDHFGFVVQGRELYGTVGNGSDNTRTTSLKSWGDDIYEEIDLEAVFTPEVKAEFWVNGVLSGSITDPSKLPTGGSYSEPIITLYIDNNGVAAESYIYISKFDVYQSRT